MEGNFTESPKYLRTRRPYYILKRYEKKKDMELNDRVKCSFYALV